MQEVYTLGQVPRLTSPRPVFDTWRADLREDEQINVHPIYDPGMPAFDDEVADWHDYAAPGPPPVPAPVLAPAPVLPPAPSPPHRDSDVETIPTPSSPVPSPAPSPPRRDSDVDAIPETPLSQQPPVPLLEIIDLIHTSESDEEGNVGAPAAGRGAVPRGHRNLFRPKGYEAVAAEVVEDDDVAGPSKPGKGGKNTRKNKTKGKKSLKGKGKMPKRKRPRIAKQYPPLDLSTDDDFV